MPTYEYQCDACGHELEEFQSIKAPPLKKCPKCGKSKLKRLIGTGAGIIFKGSGFYETDYRSEGYKKAAKSDADSAKPKTETANSDSSCACGSKTPCGTKPTTSGSTSASTSKK